MGSNCRIEKVGVQGSSMANGQYPPAFPLRHQKKDLGLAEALGQETSQPLTVASTVQKLYAQVCRPILVKLDEPLTVMRAPRHTVASSHSKLGSVV